ncbi:MAG: malate synthase A [Gammaproteobacteria bacterium]|jgi:malate synthase|nr:MAG: malate synthase [Gammaproteobacteria bacterium SG8_31]
MSGNAAGSIAPEYKITGPMKDGFDEILTPEAMTFIAELSQRFAPRVTELLEQRKKRQQAINDGRFPDFLPETRQIRESDWTIAGIPSDLTDRRVEITGPTDRKMVINALNSGASVFMADCEDSMTPTWHNVVQGQINLRDAVDGSIEFTSPEGKEYRLADKTAVLLVRPRGWHLFEKHILVDGQRAPGGLVDFGLYLFHNADKLAENGTGPYFYLPKLENHLEARLWTEVFEYAENRLGLRHGTIKCTVLIETILAAFEMDEILYVLRDYIVGLNCGRWDYIFSFIKKFQKFPDFVLPDRGQVTMTTHFLRSYSQLSIKTCHRRGAMAIGGMAAQIPIKGDPEANEVAIGKVVQDKEREAGDGHDGTWVAHPGLVPVAKEVFDKHMPGPNQLDRLRRDVEVSAADLLKLPEGTITEEGLRSNVNIGIRYMAAWLSGNGCVPIFNLMEDAATAEISRAQIWQWIRHPGGVLDDGRRVTAELYKQVRDEELGKIQADVGDAEFAGGNYRAAAELLDKITLDDEFIEFLTLVAYEEID